MSFVLSKLCENDSFVSSELGLRRKPSKESYEDKLAQYNDDMDNLFDDLRRELERKDLNRAQQTLAKMKLLSRLIVDIRKKGFK